MVARALERIEERDVQVNSCVRVLAEEARKEARRIDSSREPGGELQGVPVTVKEIFDVAGERSPQSNNRRLQPCGPNMIGGADAIDPYSAEGC